MSGSFVRSAGTWLSYGFLAFYSFFLNSMGPITSLIKSDLGLSYTIGGLHYSAFALGILILGFGGNAAIARLGRKRAFRVGAIGLSLGVVLLILGRTALITIPASFAMGLLGSLILIVVPPTLSDLHGDHLAVAISESNVIASSVAATAPLLLGASARAFGDWRPAPAIVALLPLAMLAIFRKELGIGTGMKRPRTESVSAAFPKAKAAAGEPKRRPALPRIYWAYWTCLFLAVSSEFGMISWASDFFSSVHGLDKASASGALGVFMVAMILGRVIGSRLAGRIGLHALLGAFIAVALIGFFPFWLAGNVLAALAGLFLTGIGISSLYPFLQSLAIGVAGDQTVRATAVAAIASGAAIMILPLLLGRVADAFGIRGAYVMIPLVLFALGAVVIAATARSSIPAR